MDKRHLAIGVLAGVIAFLLLFGTGQRADAGTYRTQYSVTLSCAGPDGVASTPDDSCPVGTQNNASTTTPPVPVSADIISHFEIPSAMPRYSNFALLRAFGTPAAWKLATDKEIPDGAAVGKYVSIWTVAVLGGACNVTLPVTIPMYDCTTDNSPGNKIYWSAADSGKNLLKGEKGGLPAGCTEYPDFLDNMAGGVKPRARYYGSTVRFDGEAPTQLQFALFSPQQLSQLLAPQASIMDEQGYVGVVIQNNPLAPVPPGNPLDESCTPLDINTTLWGRTGGQGTLDNDITVPYTCPGGYPCQVGNFWTVKDTCGDGIDNDNDNKVDEMCGIQRVANPADVLIPRVGSVAESGTQCCNAVDEDSDGTPDDACSCSGLWNTHTHLASAYSESYRDADGDGIVNEEDECPFYVDVGLDPDSDRIDSVCDPTPSTPNQDQDADGWRNQPDNCPLVAQVNQNDSDGDRIGDACDLNPPGNGPTTPDGNYLNDMPVGAICIGSVDTDGDGWCDATENVVGPGGGAISLANNINSVPEYRALDYAVVAASNPPGAAPRSCSNWTYYDTTSANPENGVAPEVDDDWDAWPNAADSNCAALAGDADQDGKVDASDNCINVWNPSQLDTDGSCGTVGSPAATDIPGACGDACDTDDDADNISDAGEWAQGNDAKNVCDPRNFDTTGNNAIGVADIIAFIYPLKVANRPCFPPVNYNVLR